MQEKNDLDGGIFPCCNSILAELILDQSLRLHHIGSLDRCGRVAICIKSISHYPLSFLATSKDFCVMSVPDNVIWGCMAFDMVQTYGQKRTKLLFKQGLLQTDLANFLSAISSSHQASAKEVVIEWWHSSVRITKVNIFFSQTTSSIFCGCHFVTSIEAGTTCATFSNASFVL